MSGWHSEGANGLPWEQESLERCQETDSLFVAWLLCSKAFESPWTRRASRARTSHQPPVPMPSPPAWQPRPPTELSAHLELSPHINSGTSCLF